MTDERAAVAARSEVARAIEDGEYLLAYDLAEQHLVECPDDLRLRHMLVLALARAGATDRARQELAAARLDGERRADIPPDLAEDLAALGARLAKDRAFDAAGFERTARARAAAERYEAVYQQLGRPYSCVNAATMWLVAGDRTRAGALARAALDLCLAPAADDDQPYWRAATVAEALLVLGDRDGARDALRRAVTAHPVGVAERATTRRQLLLVCEESGIPPDVLEPIAVPSVAHYCGHRIGPVGRGRFPAETEAEVAARIAATVVDTGIGFAHGSLASGADILFAEAVLQAGAQLHVVLPFAVEDFLRASVEPAGPRWVGRFQHCLDRATSTAFATTGGYFGDDTLFAHASAIAMGQAILQARSLTADAVQLAVWDGQDTSEIAGTSKDVLRWARLGRPATTIPTRPADHVADDDAAADPARASVGLPAPREVRAMLFTDVHGFSRLDESQVLRFIDVVMTPLAATLDRFSERILYRNSWGDGMYVVMDGVLPAARCALALQQAMDAIDHGAAGLPPTLGLRIGAHAGPVSRAFDPVRGQDGFFGVEVTRTARIEPRTPEGDVYVTDAFAALLALGSEPDLRCEYVGRIPTAKDYGVFPMYLLKSRR